MLDLVFSMLMIQVLGGNVQLHCSFFAVQRTHFTIRQTLGANQLNGIAKWVMHMATGHARYIKNLSSGDPRRAQLCHEAIIIRTPQSWMCFLRRTKIIFNTQVDLHGAAFEPATAAVSEFRRFRYFFHAEHAGIKIAGSLFLAWRHGELNVIDGSEAGHKRLSGGPF